MNVLYRIVIKTGDQPSVIITECPIFHTSTVSYAVDCEGSKFTVGITQLNCPDIGPLGFYHGYNIEIPQYVYMWCGRMPTRDDIKQCTEYHADIIKAMDNVSDEDIVGYVFSLGMKPEHGLRS